MSFHAHLIANAFSHCIYSLFVACNAWKWFFSFFFKYFSNLFSITSYALAARNQQSPCEQTWLHKALEQEMKELRFSIASSTPLLLLLPLPLPLPLIHWFGVIVDFHFIIYFSNHLRPFRIAFLLSLATR